MLGAICGASSESPGSGSAERGAIFSLSVKRAAEFLSGRISPPKLQVLVVTVPFESDTSSGGTVEAVE